jgi:hypothetical protein
MSGFLLLLKKRGVKSGGLHVAEESLALRGKNNERGQEDRERNRKSYFEFHVKRG